VLAAILIDLWASRVGVDRERDLVRASCNARESRDKVPVGRCPTSTARPAAG
jgi:hypothetical protein